MAKLLAAATQTTLELMTTQNFKIAIQQLIDDITELKTENQLKIIGISII